MANSIDTRTLADSIGIVFWIVVLIEIRLFLFKRNLARSIPMDLQEQLTELRAAQADERAAIAKEKEQFSAYASSSLAKIDTLQKKLTSYGDTYDLSGDIKGIRADTQAILDMVPAPSSGAPSGNGSSGAPASSGDASTVTPSPGTPPNISGPAGDVTPDLTTLKGVSTVPPSLNATPPGSPPLPPDPTQTPAQTVDPAQLDPAQRATLESSATPPPPPTEAQPQ